MNQKPMYQKYTLTGKVQENYRTHTLVLDHDLQDAYAGQFVMVWLPGIGEKPFSLAGIDPLAVTVTEVGAFSRALCKLTKNESIWIRGPFGQGFDLQGQRHLVVGGGYGAAPLSLLAKEAVKRGDAVHVCLGARTSNDLLLVENFKSLGCEVSITTDDSSLGHVGVVTDILPNVQRSFNASTLYACGPIPMLTALACWCRQIELSAQLSWEAHMRCGIGLCGSCELDDETRKSAGLPAGWLTCRDGPVSFQNPSIRESPFHVK